MLRRFWVDFLFCLMRKKKKKNYVLVFYVLDETEKRCFYFEQAKEQYKQDACHKFVTISFLNNSSFVLKQTTQSLLP